MRQRQEGAQPLLGKAPGTGPNHAPDGHDAGAEPSLTIRPFIPDEKMEIMRELASHLPTSSASSNTMF